MVYDRLITLVRFFAVDTLASHWQFLGVGICSISSRDISKIFWLFGDIPVVPWAYVWLLSWCSFLVSFVT